MSAIRRSIKNAANSYTPCERDVREATSNDKNRPSDTLVTRIANATYDVQMSKEVMGMLWKRLHDTGKFWRHVYKSLLLLEHLLKRGASHILAEIKQNIYSIQKLLDFQYLDKSNANKGVIVQKAAASLIELVYDEQKLYSERTAGALELQRLNELYGDKVIPRPSAARRRETMSHTHQRSAEPYIAHETYPSSTSSPSATSASSSYPPAAQSPRSTTSTAPIYDPPPYPPAQQQTTTTQGQPYPAVANIYTTPQEAYQQQQQPQSQRQQLPYPPQRQPARPPPPAPYPPQQQHQQTGPQTDDDMLRLAIEMSKLDAERDARQRETDRAREQEAEELAMAISLSMQESESRRHQLFNGSVLSNLQGDDSDFSDDEVTPPNSPYNGEFFGGGEAALPSYDDVQAETTHQQLQPASTNYMELPPAPEQTTNQSSLYMEVAPVQAGGMSPQSNTTASTSQQPDEMHGLDEMKDYLDLSDALGQGNSDDVGYCMVEPSDETSNSMNGASTTGYVEVDPDPSMTNSDPSLMNSKPLPPIIK